MAGLRGSGEESALDDVPSAYLVLYCELVRGFMRAEHGDNVSVEVIDRE